MESIRTHTGEIRICTACGQPCGYCPVDDTITAWMHFIEQWDGIFCPQFPLTDTTVVMQWDAESLEQVRDGYPDSPTMPASAASTDRA